MQLLSLKCFVLQIQSPSGDEFESLDSQKFGKAIAIYDFNAQTSLELSFRKVN